MTILESISVFFDNLFGSFNAFLRGTGWTPPTGPTPPPNTAHNATPWRYREFDPGWTECAEMIWRDDLNPPAWHGPQGTGAPAASRQYWDNQGNTNHWFAEWQ